MYSIRTMNKISEKGLELFSDDRFAVNDQAEDPDGVIVRSAKLHDLEFTPKLKAIARAGAGVNNIPVDRCTDHGIVVFNTPGANANGVKELVVAALLLSGRNILDGVAWARRTAEQSDELDKLMEKEKSRFAGPEIAGKTLGVVGLGAIGVMAANAATELGMRVIGHDPYISVSSAWGLYRSVERADSLDDLYAEADYITLHAPLTSATEGMINHDAIKSMKPSVRLVNMARGQLVDEESVLAALDEGKISHYATDFPTSRLARHERVIPIPHLGASTPEAEQNCAVMAADQMIDFLERGNIRNSVNFPECVMSPNDAHRVVVINRNVPNMVGQMTAVLAKKSINIADMLNRHRGNVAYTIIDLDGDVEESLLEEFRSIEGVIAVRDIGVPPQ